MDFLKKIPIRYTGELHQVRLINFSVDKEEVMPWVPEGIQIRDYKGRALISMVNVKLRNMKPGFLPDALSFNYQHIGFRLLIDDAAYSQGMQKGIYFIRSFTDKVLMALGGSLLTNYKLEKADINDSFDGFCLKQGNQFLKYRFTAKPEYQLEDRLKENVASVDRAYSYIGEQLMRVQIMRDRWPVRWIGCEGFETNFFKTARLEGAFEVAGMIPYEWLPPKPVEPCALPY
jgi:hypothetical protein